MCEGILHHVFEHDVRYIVWKVLHCVLQTTEAALAAAQLAQRAAEGRERVAQGRLTATVAAQGAAQLGALAVGCCCSIPNIVA